MARGRMVNQKIAEDLEFNCMSMEAQFLFMRTLPFLDRDGLINGHPILLSSKIVPLMPQVAANVPAAIDEWIDAGFVIRYMDGKTTVLFFTGFAENQSGMRYDREAKSEFVAPPGYKRTKAGLKPVSDPDDPQDDADTLRNDDDYDTQEYDTMPDLRRTLTGANPLEDQVESKDQVEDQEGDPRVREATGNGVYSPSSLDSVQPEYMPGLPDPRQSRRNGQRAEVGERFAEAQRLGLSAVQYRELVDALLLGFGKKALVDAGNDKALYFAQEVTLRLMRMSEAYRTPDGIQSIFQSWYSNDWRGKKGEKPTSEQFEEHASAMADGAIGKPAQFTEPKPTLSYKDWCLRQYNTDKPQVVFGLSEAKLKADYEQAIRVH